MPVNGKFTGIIDLFEFRFYFFLVEFFHVVDRYGIKLAVNRYANALLTLSGAESTGKFHLVPHAVLFYLILQIIDYLSGAFYIA